MSESETEWKADLRAAATMAKKAELLGFFPGLQTQPSDDPIQDDIERLLGALLQVAREAKASGRMRPHGRTATMVLVGLGVVDLLQAERAQRRGAMMPGDSAPAVARQIDPPAFGRPTPSVTVADELTLTKFLPPLTKFLPPSGGAFVTREELEQVSQRAAEVHAENERLRLELNDATLRAAVQGRGTDGVHEACVEFADEWSACGGDHEDALENVRAAVLREDRDRKRQLREEAQERADRLARSGLVGQASDDARWLASRAEIWLTDDVIVSIRGLIAEKTDVSRAYVDDEVAVVVERLAVLQRLLLATAPTFGSPTREAIVAWDWPVLQSVAERIEAEMARAR